MDPTPTGGQGQQLAQPIEITSGHILRTLGVVGLDRTGHRDRPTADGIEPRAISGMPVSTRHPLLHGLQDHRTNSHRTRQPVRPSGGGTPERALLGRRPDHCPPGPLLWRVSCEAGRRSCDSIPPASMLDIHRSRVTRNRVLQHRLRVPVPTAPTAQSTAPTRRRHSHKEGLGSPPSVPGTQVSPRADDSGTSSSCRESSSPDHSQPSGT